MNSRVSGQCFYTIIEWNCHSKKVKLQERDTFLWQLFFFPIQCFPLNKTSQQWFLPNHSTLPLTFFYSRLPLCNNTSQYPWVTPSCDMALVVVKIADNIKYENKLSNTMYGSTASIEPWHFPTTGSVYRVLLCVDNGSFSWKFSAFNERSLALVHPVLK